MNLENIGWLLTHFYTRFSDIFEEDIYNDSNFLSENFIFTFQFLSYLIYNMYYNTFLRRQKVAGEKAARTGLMKPYYKEFEKSIYE